jgi:hypothetical protein
MGGCIGEPETATNGVIIMIEWKRKTIRGKPIFALVDETGKELGAVRESWKLFRCDCGCGLPQWAGDETLPRFTAYQKGKTLGKYVSLSGAKMKVERTCGVQTEWMKEQLARIASGEGSIVKPYGC